MPMQLDELMKATKFTVVSFGDIGELQLEYRPAVLTDPSARMIMAQVQATTDLEQQMRIFSEFLVKVIAWWDLYEQEAPVPVTAETISKMPMSIISKITDHLRKDVNGENSQGSPQEVRQ